ncbi:MAG: acyl carrier protein [Eubacteriales bacterium]|nr:acyl carrier protein [Eubacteriales bacterium]
MNKLYNIVLGISEQKNSDITEKTDIITDLGYDSLKVIQLLSEVEENFQIEFDINEIDIEKLRSMKMLNELIDKKVREKDA